MLPHTHASTKGQILRGEMEERGDVGEETSSHAHFHIPPSLSFSRSLARILQESEVRRWCVYRVSEAVEMSTSELESEQSAAALTCFP